MSFGLDGLTVFVTGGAAGIGAATASMAAADGAAVVIADLDGDAAVDRATAIEADGGRALPIRCDVADDSSIADAVAAAVETFGSLDVLHNNAGVADAQAGGDGLGIEGEGFWRTWSTVIDVNLTGVLRCTRASLPHLRRSEAPSIVNAGSIASVVARPRTLAYSTSKAALLGMTRALALELAPSGIRVNAYCPGFTLTEMGEAFLGSAPDPDAALDQIMGNYLATEPAMPQDVAQVVCFLAGRHSRAVNGVAWPVDGGFLAWKATTEELAPRRE